MGEQTWLGALAVLVGVQEAVQQRVKRPARRGRRRVDPAGVAEVRPGVAAAAMIRRAPTARCRRRRRSPTSQAVAGRDPLHSPSGLSACWPPRAR